MQQITVSVNVGKKITEGNVAFLDRIVSHSLETAEIEIRDMMGRRGYTVWTEVREPDCIKLGMGTDIYDGKNLYVVLRTASGEQIVSVQEIVQQLLDV